MPQMGAMDARMVAPPPVSVQAEQASAPVMAGTNAGMVTVRVNFALTPK